MLIALILAIIIILILVILLFFLWQKQQQFDVYKREMNTTLNELESKTNHLQLEKIESKLNPHLFKNVLNSIQSHAYQTYFALDKLANVLDYILYESKHRFVSPKEEIDFAINLIDIHKIKISPLFELKVKVKINENDKLYTQALLAPLILIDPIENAFKHADLQSSNAFISIAFEFDAGKLSLIVSNSISEKAPLRKTNSGIGSDALEQRLKIIYGGHFKLEKFKEEQVFITKLKINLLEYNAQMHPTR